MKEENIKYNKGFTLIEVLIYVGIFSVVSTALITSSIVVISSFHKTRDIRMVLESSTVVFERLTREIRQASSIDIGNSTLGSNPGVLQLNSTNNDGSSRVVKFVMENGVLNLYVNSTLVDNLLGPNTSIQNLIFRRIQTTNGEAVKIEMTMSNNNLTNVISRNFNDTIILRGSY